MREQTDLVELCTRQVTTGTIFFCVDTAENGSFNVAKSAEPRIASEWISNSFLE